MDAVQAHDDCVAWWHDWSGRCAYSGRWREQVVRSLVILKGPIYHPTGGMVAAATTSLPEVPGGVRNWDYRYCWLRDATFTLYSLLANGDREEAGQWRDWLVGAVSREPWTMHVMYRVDGSHDLQEHELPWLPGHCGARPVRIGNGANAQFQIDTRGEVMDVLHVAHQNGLDIGDDAWGLQLALLDDLERRWREPDHGIWEMRGDTAHFVHSKALAWVAFDRGVLLAEHDHMDLMEGPVDRWRAIRDEIREDVYRHGFDRERGVFVQRYGAPDLDGSCGAPALISNSPMPAVAAWRDPSASRPTVTTPRSGPPNTRCGRRSAPPPRTRCCSRTAFPAASRSASARAGSRSTWPKCCGCRCMALRPRSGAPPAHRQPLPTEQHHDRPTAQRMPHLVHRRRLHPRGRR
ncbi:MAG: glycoside hydrolase family 15 protein [Pseudomonadota bacterium]|nr:glycoside hydrolase family 15 protein [Pseudomonadota bacterium]